MRASRASLRREQLDRLLTVLPDFPSPPTRGWVRAIREALGMTLESFGRRLGINKSSARKLEVAAESDAITVRKLREVAAALECDLVVMLVPRTGLESLVTERARKAARRQLDPVRHTMVMERQAIHQARLDKMVEELAAEMVARGDQALWAED